MPKALLSVLLLAMCLNSFANDTFKMSNNFTSVKSQLQRKKLGSKDNWFLVLTKESLGKEFLLSANIVTQATIPKFQGLQTRIVIFKKFGKKIYMLESGKKHRVPNTLPQQLLLASFPIEEQDDETITLDFNSGMNKLYSSQEWKASDYEGREYKPDYKTAQVLESFIEKIEINDQKNRLLIKQVALLKGEDSNTPVNTSYYLTPYRLNEGFTPYSIKDYDRMGFFNVMPIFNKEGQSNVYASKFDIRKPIVFAVSSNTPDNYKEAVKDGVRYFQKILGEDKIKVIDAPEGVNAPHPDYNVIQWVKWDNAGSAYADAQADPRTGETLHAQVYMTSAFAIGGKARARKLLRKWKEQEKHARHEHSSISLSNFHNDHNCDFNATKHLREMTERVLSMTNVTDQTILRAGQDYIREVIAHEVGHTLGLRHNFAGSLETNFGPEERAIHYKSYIEKDELPAGIIPSSSVMEYQVGVEAMFSGALMRAKDTKALPYDVVALKSLYENKTYSRHEVPLFCTDSHANKYLDCKRFDWGTNLFSYIHSAQNSMIKDMPSRLAEVFISMIAPPKGLTAQKLEDFSVNPMSDLKRIMGLRSEVMTAMRPGQKWLAVRRSFSKESPLNTQSILDAETKHRAKLMSEAPPLAETLKILTKETFTKWAFSFENLIEHPAYKSGVGAGEQNYTLSNIQLAEMKSIAHKYFDIMSKKAPLIDISTLGTGKIIDEKSTDALREILEERMRHYILSKDSARTLQGQFFRPKTGSDLSKCLNKEDRTTNECSSVRYVLQNPVYPQKVRTAASKLLSKSRSKGMSFSWPGTAIKNAHKKYIESSLGGLKLSKSEARSLASYSEELATWLLNEKSVESSLSSY